MLSAEDAKALLPEIVAATRKAIKAEPQNGKTWNQDILTIEKLIKKIKAGQLSKKILEVLRDQVSNTMAADTLQNGNHGTAGSPKTDPEFPGYQYWYNVSNVAGSTAVQVDITVRTP